MQGRGTQRSERKRVLQASQLSKKLSVARRRWRPAPEGILKTMLRRVGLIAGAMGSL